MVRQVILLVLTAFLFSFGSTATAQNSYLVEGEYIDPGVLLPRDQAMGMIEAVITPSLEMLAKWAADGKIMGGVAAGARRGVFVMKAASNEEVDDMLGSLPFWGLLKWNVTPLHSFAKRAAKEREMFKMMKEKGKEKGK